MSNVNGLPVRVFFVVVFFSARLNFPCEFVSSICTVFFLDSCVVIAHLLVTVA